MKALFNQGPSLTVRLVIVSIISIALMMVDHRQHNLESIRAAASLLIYPLQYVVDLPVSATQWASENFTSRGSLLDENKKLRMQQTLLLARLQKLAALKTENIRLRELLQSSKKVGENVLIGELLAVDLEPFTRQIIINKGGQDDVFLGQPLLDAGGIMGQIVHVGPFSSTAMLITDPNHAIPVQVNRNGLRAIVVGTGATDLLEIPYLPNSADIVIGDLLTSSGLGGRFPPDYPVAEVADVRKDPSQPYAVVYAKPAANLERSREVLLVWRNDLSAKEQPIQDIAVAKEQPPNIPVAKKQPVQDIPVAKEQIPDIPVTKKQELLVPEPQTAQSPKATTPAQ